MPFYEYIAVDPEKSCSYCMNRFEEVQSIRDEPLSVCPKCSNPVEKLVSLPAAFLDKNREVNQYNDVKGAKFWRDKNGVRHKVTAADGDRSSPTVSSRKVRSDEQIAAIKKRTDQIRKKKWTEARNRRTMKVVKHSLENYKK